VEGRGGQLASLGYINVVAVLNKHVNGENSITAKVLNTEINK